MELDFQKNGQKYVATFEVNSDFNLHIEKKRGEMYIYQKSTPIGEYDSVSMPLISQLDEVFDSDFTALVYPKYIKIVCTTEPTMAIVTMAE